MQPKDLFPRGWREIGAFDAVGLVRGRMGLAAHAWGRPLSP